MSNIMDLHQKQKDEYNKKIDELSEQINKIEEEIGFKDETGKPYEHRKDKVGRARWNKIQDMYQIELMERQMLFHEINEINNKMYELDHGNIGQEMEETTIEDLIEQTKEIYAEKIKKHPPTKEDKEKAEILRELSERISKEASVIKYRIGYYAPDFTKWCNHNDKDGRKKWEQIQDEHEAELNEIENKSKLAGDIKAVADELDPEHYINEEFPMMVKAFMESDLEDEYKKASIAFMMPGNIADIITRSQLDKEAVEREYQKEIKRRQEKEES